MRDAASGYSNVVHVMHTIECYLYVTAAYCVWFCADGMQAAVSNNSPVLPAFAYGMNLQLVRGQPQMPMEPFRILTTCSWEQNAYTVKIYVPLHGVKTDLLRAVFQPHTLDIKAINLQVRFKIICQNLVCSLFTFLHKLVSIVSDGQAALCSALQSNVAAQVPVVHCLKGFVLGTGEELHFQY